MMSEAQASTHGAREGTCFIEQVWGRRLVGGLKSVSLHRKFIRMMELDVPDGPCVTAFVKAFNVSAKTELEGRL